MILRTIEKADVQIKLGWLARDDQRRVYAHLRGCSFINWTGWFKDWTESPAQQAVVMLHLHRKAMKIIKALKAYEHAG